MTSYVHHRLDIYDADLYIVRSKAAWKSLRETTLPDLPKFIKGHQASCTSMANDEGQHLIFYFKSTDVNTIAHESYHGAALLMDNIQAEYDGSSEPMAWLVGWLTEWLWGHLHR